MELIGLGGLYGLDWNGVGWSGLEWSGAGVR